MKTYIFFMLAGLGCVPLLMGCADQFDHRDTVAGWWYNQEPDDFHLGDPTGGASRMGAGRGGGSSLSSRSSTNH